MCTTNLPSIPPPPSFFPPGAGGPRGPPPPPPRGGRGGGGGGRGGGGGGTGNSPRPPGRSRAGERQKRLASGRNGLSGVRYFHDAQYWKMRKRKKMSSASPAKIAAPTQLLLRNAPKHCSPSHSLITQYL